MIGYRLWGLGTTSNIGCVEDYTLTSVGINYLWPAKTVGNDVSFLVNPHAEDTAGYCISEERYITQSELDKILPEFDLNDPRWEDDLYWDTEYSDYIIWDWIANSSKVCPEYGFHAYSDLQSLTDDSLYQELGSFYVGVVSGYGKVHKHTKGFRSQYMTALAVANDGPGEEKALVYIEPLKRWKINPHLSNKEALTIVSEKLNIPLVTFNELYEMERQYAVR